jgi:hypothetical protein
MKFIIELEGNAPEWSNEATYYFENWYGEQWIAKIDNDEEKIVIAGLDIGWKEIVVSFEKAKEYLEIQNEGMFAISKKDCEIFLDKIEKARKNNNPLYKWIFNDEERHWLKAILTPFVKAIELEQRNVS